MIDPSGKQREHECNNCNCVTKQTLTFRNFGYVWKCQSCFADADRKKDNPVWSKQNLIDFLKEQEII